MNTPQTQPCRPYPLWRRLIKIFLWTVLAVVLAITATLITVVATLSPERLTPLVTAVANRALDARVDIARVELGLKATFPFLRLDVDSLTILSPKMMELRSRRSDLPASADTIVSIDRFTGGISLVALAKGDISLSDVAITSPRVNIVVIDDNVNNFNIFPLDSLDTEVVEEADESDTALPRITIDRFRVETPGRFSYVDIANGTEAVVTLRRAGIIGKDAPAYRFELSGNLLTPLLGRFNLSDFPFSLDGTVDWDSEHPYNLRLDGFDVGLAFIKGRFSAGLDFENDLIINSFETKVEPVEINALLATVPDSMSEAWHLDRIHTDGSIAVAMRLDSTYNTALEKLPYATVDIAVGDCKAGYGRAQFKNVTIDLGVRLCGDDLSRASAELRRLNVAGPATDLTLSGTVDGFDDDPLIDACLKGYSDIARLPSIVSDMLKGYISGRLDFDVDFIGRPSMLTANRFHNLKITGDIDGRDLYWLGNDTSTMARISKMCLQFGSNKRFNNGVKTVDSLLTAVLRVDSAEVLSGDISIVTGGLTLGAGAAHLSSLGDTTVVTPLGGGLKVRNFNLLSISDSIVFKARDIDGRVAMRRFNSEARVPQFVFNLGVRRIAAGDPSTRFMMSRAQVDFEAHKLPRRRMSEAMKRTVDSIKQVHPYLPPDSVYRLAFAKHRRHRGHHEPRVHPELTQAETEIIDWGTSKSLRRLLLTWSLDGSIKARRAGLFSAYFPIRNRIRNLDIRFNNDSIIIDSLAYKAGHSDFLVKGIISNMRRGLTSRGFRSPLKINFDILSDTVDVNELTYTSMLGSSYAVRRSRGESAFGVDYDASDEALDQRVAAAASETEDSVRPILMPVNIDARIDVTGRNVLYSDLDLKDMTGEILAYDGALSLHNLKANSNAGSLGLSALYAAPAATDIKFGFGLTVKKFNIERFERLIPAIDSIVPLLKDVAGIIDADVAATVDLSPNLDFKLPTLDAAVRITGDSLTIIDPETFKTMAKWLMFKDKQHNLIKHMSVSFLVEDNMLRVYPFIFDIDRYRLGVRGYNDLDFNFDYHVAVLKSPLPFKFGINIKGSPDKYKIRVGGAKFKADEAVDRPVVVDSARVNLIGQIEDIFRRGVSRSRFAGLQVGERPSAASIDLSTDTLTRADSLSLMREGLIPPELTKDNTAY
ncbi:MAG: hypothetical protein ACI4AX_05135 [Muribaculaceae bacterium]